MKEGTITKLNQLGKLIFYNGIPVAFEYLVNKSLSGNTYRGFHRLDKSGEGAAVIFRRFLHENDSYFLKTLSSIKNVTEYHKFLNIVCNGLRKELTNIIPKQLTSYNKVRKPLDIYFEHLISMDERYSKYRNRLIPFLNLPLDSWMFKDRFVFSDEELKLLRIKRSFTFTNIKSEKHYIEIQDFLREKAAKEGLKELVYFDLLWGKRHEKTGLNLFELNPTRDQSGTVKKSKKQKVINTIMGNDRDFIEGFIERFNKENSSLIEFNERKNKGEYIAELPSSFANGGGTKNVCTVYFPVKESTRTTVLFWKVEGRQNKKIYSNEENFRTLFEKYFKVKYDEITG